MHQVQSIESIHGEISVATRRNITSLMILGPSLEYALAQVRMPCTSNDKDTASEHQWHITNIRYNRLTELQERY